MARVVVTITTEDIVNGVKKSMTHCPYALACKRQGYAKAMFRDDDFTLDGVTFYTTPGPVQSVIAVYDNGKSAQTLMIPHTWEIDLED